MWPWNPTTGFSLSTTADDEFHAGIVIKKGIIPVLDVTGSVYYDKWGLLNSVADGSFRFFDAKTAFAAELSCPVPGAPNCAIAITFKMVPSRDALGNVEYSLDSGKSSGVQRSLSSPLEPFFLNPFFSFGFILRPAASAAASVPGTTTGSATGSAAATPSAPSPVHIGPFLF